MIEFTKQQVADFLECDIRTITRYQVQEDNPLPVYSKGARGIASVYDAIAVHKWDIQRKLVPYQNGTYDLEEERARLTHHQANKVSLEEKALKGEYIHVDEVKEGWSQIVTAIRAKLLALPNKAAHLFVGINSNEQAHDILKKEVYLALTELSQEKYD